MHSGDFYITCKFVTYKCVFNTHFLVFCSFLIVPLVKFCTTMLRYSIFACYHKGKYVLGDGQIIFSIYLYKYFHVWYIRVFFLGSSVITLETLHQPSNTALIFDLTFAGESDHWVVNLVFTKFQISFSFDIK